MTQFARCSMKNCLVKKKLKSELSSTPICEYSAITVCARDRREVIA